MINEKRSYTTFMIILDLRVILDLMHDLTCTSVTGMSTWYRIISTSAEFDLEDVCKEKEENNIKFTEFLTIY